MPPRTTHPATGRGRRLRLGVFGGTFDPPHVGHLMIAERARDQLRLDRVMFIPSGNPPHKRRRQLSPAPDRVAMTRLAVRGNPAFRVSTLEVARPGSSYTVDTLRTLRARNPGARLYLLIGEDSLNELHTWHEPESVHALATLVVAPRPGGAAPRPHRRDRQSSAGAAIRRGTRTVWLDGPRLELSSSGIRARVRAGRSIRHLVPEPVERYLAARELYRRRG
jgi:nicotinate-nucleotide adenylyltransferase